MGAVTIAWGSVPGRRFDMGKSANQKSKNKNQK
jgi:hypothetical protein